MEYKLPLKSNGVTEKDRQTTLQPSRESKTFYRTNVLQSFSEQQQKKYSTSKYIDDSIVEDSAEARVKKMLVFEAKSRMMSIGSSSTALRSIHFDKFSFVAESNIEKV